MECRKEIPWVILIEIPTTYKKNFRKTLQNFLHTKPMYLGNFNFQDIS